MGACLENTCSMSGMVVKLDVELFHTNGQDAAAFVDQLTNGTRDLSMNGTPLANGSWSASGNTITVKVNYADDNVTPTMSEKNGKNFINYGVQFASNGNAPGFPTIEFYVDTKIEAECEYPPTSWSRPTDSGSTRRTSKWPWPAMAISPQTSTADFTPTKTVTTKSCRTTSSTWARCSMVWSMPTNFTASASS